MVLYSLIFKTLIYLLPCLLLGGKLNNVMNVQRRSVDCCRYMSPRRDGHQRPFSSGTPQGCLIAPDDATTPRKNLTSATDKGRTRNTKVCRFDLILQFILIKPNISCRNVYLLSELVSCYFNANYIGSHVYVYGEES